MSAFNRAGGVGVGGSNPLVPTKIFKTWLLCDALIRHFIGGRRTALMQI